MQVATVLTSDFPGARWRQLLLLAGGALRAAASLPTSLPSILGSAVTSGPQAQGHSPS